ncbi:hypothetical protein GCM10018785_26880 [Streptomyces longispororuber]|uniref:Uncharacterized protein n=1 Tax=Streptomyces longispororuber TaxID=68230 RepID=A0A918ZLI0_9ACTN|nr:hypothetical protein [Streptomyces longispororuber]GHE56217.1 hypothetical protein GCM10018785_26880 [Streptomyces longispororuber]
MGTEEWSLAVAALSLLVSGLTTAWTVKYARAQLRHAHQVQKEASEPYVVVDIEPSDPGSLAMVLSVQNTGPTMARNVRITATPELTSSEGDDITKMLQRVLARPIPMLPPGRRLKYFFDTNQRFQSDLPMTFYFTVNAQGPGGDVEPLHYNVDLSVYGEALVGQRPTKFLEERLKKLEKPLVKLVKYYGAVNQPAIRAEAERRMAAWHRHQEELWPGSTGGADSGSS